MIPSHPTRESVAANRVVLAAVSPVMRNVFTKRENLMNAEMLPLEALHEIILFIYNASAEVKVDVIKKIEKASRVLQMNVLTTMCTNVLATVPDCEVKHFDDDTMASRRRRLSRVKDRDSFPRDSTLLSSSILSESKVHSLDDSESGSSVSAADISDMLVTKSKRGRPSIRINFGGQNGTPLSRSAEDLSQLIESSSSDTYDSQSVTSRGSYGVESLKDAASPEEKEPKWANRSWEEKRKQFSAKKQPYASSSKLAKLDSVESKNKPPIPLSKLLHDANRKSVSSVGTIGPHYGAYLPTSKSVDNLTWPKKIVGPPSRSSIPAEWKKTIAPGSVSEPPLKSIRSNSNENNRSVKNSRMTQDKFSFGFKSKSIPNLLKGLNSLREQGLFCDLTIAVANLKISCHKVVLAASSEVFCAILRKIKSREIQLTKIDETAVQEMIKFIYTGQCSIDKDNVMAMMRGSRRFQLHFVARKCAAYLDQFVASSPNIFSPENVLNIYKAADEYVFPRLRDESRKFAALRFWDLIGTQCFKDLSFTELNRLLGNELLSASRIRDRDQELKLFRGLVHWLHHSSQTRIPHMTSRVMKFVNFSNMKNDALVRVVAKEATIMRNQETRDRVIEALRDTSSITKRSQSTQLLQSPLADKSVENVYAFVSEIDSETSEKKNNLYNLTQLDEKRRFVASSPVAWNGHAVTSHDGKIYVAGGRDVKTNKRISSEVYRFSPTVGWQQLPNMLIPRSHFSLVPLDGAIYAIGGLSENSDQQYIACQNSERLNIDSPLDDLKWTMTSWLLPYPSYSHAAATCGMTQSHGNTLSVPNDPKKKSFGSPMRKRGMRLSAPFADGKSPLAGGRNSPKPIGKYRKIDPDSNLPIQSSETVFLCGGKVNPRQNLVLEGSNFIEKSPLPCPCTQLSMTSYNFNVYVACDDVMETSQFRMFEYSVDMDVWTEMKVPVLFEKPLASLNIDVLANGDKSHPNTFINCASAATGIYLAIAVNDVISINHLDVTSSKWSAHERTKIKCPASDFSLCTLISSSG